MFRPSLLRGASAGALTLVFLPFVSMAQEALPTIDIGSSRPARAASASGRAEKNALGGRLTGYNVVGPVASTKTDIPILQTPMAIQVVPRQTMDDRQAITVQDAVSSNVSSVLPSGHTFYDRFIIRGFDIGQNTYRNGLRQYLLTNLETANLQTIEVVKGPAAMLYGRIEPGGLINLVPKRPSFDENYVSVQQQIGSFDLKRTTVDVTGPLNAEKTLAYRFNGVYLDRGSHRDFIERENVFLAPTLSFRPNDSITLNIDGEYQNVGFTTDTWTGIPAIGRSPANVPIYRNYTDPTLTLAKPNRLERRFIGYDITVKLADDWKVTNRFSYLDADFAENDPFAGDFDTTDGSVSRYIWYSNRNQRTVSANLDLQGKFDTGPFEHRVLLGGDFHDNLHVSSSHCCDAPALERINIWYPNYYGLGWAQLNALRINSYSRLEENWKGIYGQDQISFLEDKVHILLGGRYDSATYGSASGPTAYHAVLRMNPIPVSAFSPRVGVVIQPLPWLSFYGNYTRSVGSNNGRLASGEAFPPQHGTQFEGGVKAELLDGALTATFAYFDITKTNILAAVPGTIYQRAVGEAQSNGVELDVTGRIDENWSVIANYSHTNARVTKDNAADGGPGTTGNRLPTVPFNSGNLWVKYEADGALRGLTLAGGVNAIGERKGDVENTYELPAYALLNAMLAYRFQPAELPWVRNLTLQVNVNNILDTTHYVSGHNGRLSITPGAPRAVLVSLRAEF
jgi:iron complex outermembrane receptor protein